MRRAGERERGDEPVTPGLSAIMRWYQPVTRTICTLWSTFRLLLVFAGMAVGIPYTRYHVVSTRRVGNIHNLVSACKKLEWPKMQKNETYFLSLFASAFNVRDASRRDQHINQDRRLCSQRHDLHIY